MIPWESNLDDIFSLCVQISKTEWLAFASNQTSKPQNPKSSDFVALKIAS